MSTYSRWIGGSFLKRKEKPSRLMWSILAANIQTAHDRDPSAYHFKDFITYEDYLNPTQDEMKAYKVTRFFCSRSHA